MEWLNDSVTAPEGFQTYGTACGIKKEGLDLALLYSEEPCTYAGVFTKNLVKAAPLDWNMALLEEEQKINAVLINSGNANACTGNAGHKVVEESARTLAGMLDVDEKNILLASTGVIGVQMPFEPIKKGITALVENLEQSAEHSHISAKAIMTTDTYPKEGALSVTIDGYQIKIGAIAKGSGMIHPNMGTMLSFVTTDAAIEQKALQELLKSSVNDTYNMISVDGDTSTNDMVVILANGCAGNEPIKYGSAQYRAFEKAMTMLNEKMAKLIAGDGEGASKLIEVNAEGLLNKEDARKMVHAIISSSLVKTAIFGGDANWGRVLCAMGYSKAEFDPSNVDLSFSNKKENVQLMKYGTPVSFDETIAKEILEDELIQIQVNCHSGWASAKGWGCDLSHDYITINGSYRT